MQLCCKFKIIYNLCHFKHSFLYRYQNRAYIIEIEIRLQSNQKHTANILAKDAIPLTNHPPYSILHTTKFEFIVAEQSISATQTGVGGTKLSSSYPDLDNRIIGLRRGCWQPPLVKLFWHRLSNTNSIAFLSAKYVQHSMARAASSRATYPPTPQHFASSVWTT